MYICPTCERKYKRKDYFESHLEKCEPTEIENTEAWEVAEAPEVEFKVGDMVQHRLLGDKFEVVGIENGMIVRQVTRRGTKLYKPEELKPYLP